MLPTQRVGLRVCGRSIAVEHNMTSPRFRPNQTPCGRTRREFLWQIGGGFAGLALLDLLAQDSAQARPDPERKPHFEAKAKHVVFLFMNGAPSQVDTFDPKPALK